MRERKKERGMRAASWCWRETPGTAPGFTTLGLSIENNYKEKYRERKKEQKKAKREKKVKERKKVERQRGLVEVVLDHPSTARGLTTL